MDERVDYAGDVDYWKFYAYGGGNYIFRIVSNEQGSGLDPTLALYDSNGTTQLQYVDDYDGLDPVIHFLAPGDGYYYLAVRGFSNSQIGDYSIETDSPVYMSMAANGAVDGMKYRSGDVLVYYSCADYWDMFLNAKNLGFKGNLTGLALLPDRRALTVFGSNQKFYGETVSPYDIATCFLSDVGWDSSWDCSLLFDGQDVGLTTSGEKIKSIAVGYGGSLLLTITGKAQVPGITSTVENEDILKFQPDRFGSNTQGIWSKWWDGSLVGTTKVRIEGLWINRFTFDHVQTFDKRVTPSGSYYTVEKGDIASCLATGLNTYSGCSYWWIPFFGTYAGMKPNAAIDAIDFGSELTLDNSLLSLTSPEPDK